MNKPVKDHAEHAEHAVQPQGNPFKDPRQIHAFINVDKSPLDENQSHKLAGIVKKFIHDVVDEKAGRAGSSHVWVRTSNQ